MPFGSRWKVSSVQSSRVLIGRMPNVTQEIGSGRLKGLWNKNGQQRHAVPTLRNRLRRQNGRRVASHTVDTGNTLH